MSFMNMLYRTGTSNVNTELERAINERNCDEVKILISTGADINHTVNQNLDTMLHTAKTAGIACDLLGYSANVNARNLYEKTPLHSAVLNGRNPEFVRTLLCHGADVDARDSTGNTPLNYAVQKTDKDLCVVKELVTHGADINARSNESRRFNNNCTPLDNAVLQNDLDCIKVLIKNTLLKKCCQVRMNPINIRNYYRRENYHAILQYLNNCNDEILRMKREKMNRNVSLHDIVMTQFVCRDSLYKDSDSTRMLTERAFAILTSDSYPIYHDMILTKLKSKLEKPSLMQKLNSIQVYTMLGTDQHPRKVILDSDSTNAVAKCLSKFDLFNLILAYYDPSKHSVQPNYSISNLLEIRKMLNKRVCEASASTSSSYAKHFKFA